MTKENIDEIYDKIGRMVERCISFPNYKVLIYFKNKDNFTKFHKYVYSKIERGVCTYGINIDSSGVKNSKESVSYKTYFENGSRVLMLVCDDNVIGEKCNVLFVDSEIKEEELLELSPQIFVYEFEGGGMLNPKPIYFSV